MAGRRNVEQVVILKSKFDLDDRRVFFGKARLLPDRIVLKGVGYKKVVKLDEIQEVGWSSDLLSLFLTSGEELDMMIQSAALWKFELQARCGFTDATNTSNSSTDFAKVSSVTNEGDRTQIEDESDDDSNGSSDQAESESLPKRESSYRVRTGFANDRPTSRS